MAEATGGGLDPGDVGRHIAAARPTVCLRERRLLVDAVMVWGSFAYL